jgi:cation transport regulator ChaC
MNDIFKRGMKQFAKGVAYRLVADAVKDGAKKLHERYCRLKTFIYFLRHLPINRQYPLQIPPLLL